MITRQIAALTLLLMLAAGCVSKPALAPPQAPAVLPEVKEFPWPQPGPAWAPPVVPFTSDLPTFPQTDAGGPPFPAGITLTGPRAPLAEVAAEIDRTGSPPVGTVALKGDRYIYPISQIPRPDPPQVYLLAKGREGWTAEPICRGLSQWYWAGARNPPIFICGVTEGSGGMLSLAVYREREVVFSARGLFSGRLIFGDSRDGQPPDLILQKDLWWLDHKLDPRVTERFTFTWKDGTYVLVRHERMADWVYHLARFVEFVAGGRLAQAEAEFATPPPGGLGAYLSANAPDLRTYGGGKLWTAGRVNNYLTPSQSQNGPWFRFEFDARTGRLTAVLQEK